MLRNINYTDIISLFLYVVVFFFSILFYSKYSKRKNTIFLIFSILIVALLATFRKSGTDYYNYNNIYVSISNMNNTRDFFSNYIEFGWKILNLVSFNYNMVLFVSAFMFLSFSAASINYFTKRYKTISWSILLLVFYGVFINIMRQMLAVSIFSYACVFLFKKKTLGKRMTLYIFWVLIAALFHKSALLMLVLPFIFLIRNRKFLLMLIIVSCPFIPIISVVVFGVLRHFNIYQSYIGNEMDVSFLFILCMIPPFILMVLYLFNIGNFKKEKTLDALICIFALCFPIQVFGFMAKNVDRLTYYFYFMMIFIVPMIISNNRKYVQRLNIKILSYVWYVFYYFAVFFIVNLTDMFPYIK